MKSSKILWWSALFIGVFIFALLSGAVFQTRFWERFLAPKPVQESQRVEKEIQERVHKVLDRVVGKGKHYVTVKAEMSESAESSEKWVYQPSIATSNSQTELTYNAATETLDPESVKAYNQQKPVQKIVTSLPGFPVLNPVDPSTIPEVPTKTIRTPAQLTTLSETKDVFFNQEVIKKETPRLVSRIVLHVVVDERKVTLLGINQDKLMAVIAEVAGINEARGDQLVFSTYQFSNAVFGLDLFLLQTKSRIRDLALAPEYYVGGGALFFALVGAGILFWLWRKKVKRHRLKLLEIQQNNQRQVLRDEQEVERAFQTLCKSLLDFVEKNPVFVASVVSEMATMAHSDDQNATLSPLKKVLIFILFLEAERPKLVHEVLTEVGESISKTLFLGANKFMKVDASVLKTVLEEFYHLLVKKRFLIAGPLLSQKILKTTFGEAKRNLDIESEFSFQFLEKISDSRLVAFLDQEEPQLSALMLSFLDENRVVSILSQLDVDRAVVISQKMLTLDVPSYHLIQKLSSSIEVKLMAPEASEGNHEKLVKVSRVIEKVSQELREKLMVFLETVDPVLVQKIRALIFTFEDFITLSDAHLKAIVFESDVQELGLAMLGCEGVLRDKLLAVLSERMRAVVDESLKFSEGVKPAQIEKAQYALVKLARRLSDEGRIILRVGDQ